MQLILELEAAHPRGAAAPATCGACVAPGAARGGAGGRGARRGGACRRGPRWEAVGGKLLVHARGGDRPVSPSFLLVGGGQWCGRILGMSLLCVEASRLSSWLWGRNAIVGGLPLLQHLCRFGFTPYEVTQGEQVVAVVSMARLRRGGLAPGLGNCCSMHVGVTACDFTITLGYCWLPLPCLCTTLVAPHHVPGGRSLLSHVRRAPAAAGLRHGSLSSGPGRLKLRHMRLLLTRRRCGRSLLPRLASSCWVCLGIILRGSSTVR